MVFRQHRGSSTEIGLIVEGASDFDTIPILVEKILGARKIRPVIRKRVVRRGTLLGNPRRVEAILNVLLASHSHIKKLLVWVDCECTSPQDLESEIEKVERQLAHLNPKPKYILVVHALESWLMGDDQAVAKVLGPRASVRSVANPEGLCKPKSQLSRMFSRAGKRFIHTQHDRARAEAMENVNQIKRRCPSFAKFCRAVLDRWASSSSS